MELDADTSVTFGGVLDASLRQGILEVLGSRSLDVSAGSLALLAGVRWWDNKVRASFDPAIINDGAFAYDTTTHGPLLGLVTNF